MNEKDRAEFEIRVKTLEYEVRSLNKRSFWMSLIITLLAFSSLIESIANFIR